MRVLIVEDSAIVAERIQLMLSEVSTNIAVVGLARDALEALEAFRTQNPDLVILDLHLPGKSGLDILDAMRRERRLPVILILTNYPHPQYRKRCLDAGAAFFFDKSTDFEKVRDVVLQLLQDPPTQRGAVR